MSASDLKEIFCAYVIPGFVEFGKGFITVQYAFEVAAFCTFIG
jgi:hypothetical protein